MTNKPKTLVISVSAAARSGKDLFCKLLQEKLLKDYNQKSHKIAIANELKAEVHEFLLNNFKLDSFSELTEDKKKFRELLVWYGNLKREMTNGSYWLTKIQSRVENNIKNNIITLISDVRFAEKGENDELFYVQNVWKGKAVFLTLYMEDVGGNRYMVPPANDHEERNNKIIEAEADYKLTWDYCHGEFDLLDPHILNFTNWLYETK